MDLPERGAKSAKKCSGGGQMLRGGNAPPEELRGVFVSVAPPLLDAPVPNQC